MRRTPPAGNPIAPKSHDATARSRIYATDGHLGVLLPGTVFDDTADFALKGPSDLGL